jgi:hypothetical protein
MNWRQEIIELHEFFEGYYLGRLDSLERPEAAFHRAMTFVAPDGSVSDRAQLMTMLADGHGHTSSLTIETVDHRLLYEADEVTVASYVERHVLTERTNQRLSTVVFVPGPGPNGLQWLRVHETWLPDLA